MDCVNFYLQEVPVELVKEEPSEQGTERERVRERGGLAHLRGNVGSYFKSAISCVGDW